MHAMPTDYLCRFDVRPLQVVVDVGGAAVRTWIRSALALTRGVDDSDAVLLDGEKQGP